MKMWPAGRFLLAGVLAGGFGALAGEEKPAEAGKALGEVLAKKIDVSYRRAFVSEVLTGDLNARFGLRHAFAEPVAKCATFTFEAKEIAVKEVLQLLATACALDIEYRGDTAGRHHAV